MVWEICNGLVVKTPVTTFNQHTGEVLSVEFIDGMRVCSTSSNNEVFIWNALNGEKQAAIEVTDTCMCCTYCADNKRLVLGLLDGTITAYDTVKFERLQSYEVHAPITAVDCVSSEEEGTTYMLGTINGTVYVLYDYDDRMQLVKTTSLKDPCIITSIIINKKEHICYVTCSNSKILVYTTHELGMVARYKGVVTNCMAIRPSLSQDTTLLYVASKDGGVFFFPNSPPPIRKSTDLTGQKVTMFAGEGKRVIHVSQIPNSNNLLVIDEDGGAAVFNIKL